MKMFLHLLKQDTLLLQRYKLFSVSLGVTVIYLIILKTIASFMAVDGVLLLIVFNDPALLGFLFVGVMVLFERNENTLQALAVSPMRLETYILSKTIVLSLLSLVCCYVMAIFSIAESVNYVYYTIAALTSTMLFAFIGFILVANSSNFNQFMLKAVGVLILLSLPFLGYFEVMPRSLFLLFPTQACIDLFRCSFGESLNGFEWLYVIISMLVWLFLGYKYSVKLLKINFYR